MSSLIIQAYTLLVMASSLLTQVANTPNASPELRQNAQNTAQIAITFATAVIEDSVRISPVLAQPTEVSTTSTKTAPNTWVCVYKDGKEVGCGG